ncbi:MAG: Smr/MutS family protein [Gemmatimonadota bacterium]|nr:Smr/MutS family protein [Gemmatimonadota bacterium]MDH5759216.1 Smr/MutS family protein [Gemmatimonadota bacterium]
MGKRRPTTPSPPDLPETLHGAVADAELDLHGMNVQQALRRVENLLETWARRQPGAVLRVVTGKGTRSADGPVLLGAVGDFLREETGGRVAEMIRAAGGGGWMVRVGRTGGRSGPRA